MRGRTLKGLLRVVAVLCTGIWALTFALPSGAGAAAAAANDTCSYASSSFTESTVMRWAQVNGTGSSAQFVAYANDEAGLLLGVNGATPLSSATQNGSNGQAGGTSFHVSNASGGSTTALDPSGRPFYPALYITDLTTNPLNGAGTGVGDFQNGGTPRNLNGGVPFIDDVFGSWTTATVSGGNYTATKPSTKNDWNLGSTSDAPVGTTFSAMGDEGYGSEVRWNVNELTDSNGQTLKPGDTYRIQVLEHDGDQNKAGGDAGEFCATLSIPKASPALTTDAVGGTVGQPIHDVAHLTGGTNPTGTISWNVYASSDTTCHTPLNTSAITATVNGAGDYPSPNFTPSTAGGYRWVATYSGDSANNAPPATSCSDPRELSTVGPATPLLTTQAHSAAVVGSPISDTATLTGVSPTGSITWNVFAGTDGTCATPLNAQPSTLVTTVSLGNGSYDSPTFTPTSAGSYKWVATYSGDSNNVSVSTLCGDPAEVSTVGKATPMLTTQAHSAVVVGSPISDTATLNGTSPTGSITWNVFASSDLGCSTPLNAQPSTLVTSVSSGNGSYNSPTFTPTSAGSYKWVATYSGDTNNASVSTLCGDPAEVSTVGKATPTLTTQAHSAAVVGSPISDTATLTGVSPTGSITWNVFAGTDGTCATPLNAQPSTLVTSVSLGNGSYDSPTFTPSSAGSYKWVATYSGDANNASVSTACSDPNEVSTVGKATPTLTTIAHSAVVVGSPISDTATLNGTSPTGSITWNVFASSDLGCSTPLNAQPSTLVTSVSSGNGSYNSPTFTPTSAGSYKWVATYSGDTNNASVSTLCGDPAEVSTVGKATPTLTTNATAALVGGTIHDVAHLTGGSSPTGTISWNVYASSDTACHTPLNASAISVSVSGDGDYTSPDFTPAAAGSYQWVATYSGDGNNVSLSTACGDPNEVSTVTNNAAPAITLHKLERIGSSGSFTHGPVTGNVGDTVEYRMMVTNTGNTTLVIAFTDAQCDSGTLSAATVLSGTYDAATQLLSAGGELLFTCSHVLAAGDQPYTNTASVIGTPPSGPPVSATDSVDAFANEPGIKVVKLQRDGTSGRFTSNQITASVGDTIFYKIQVTNTGNVPLTLSLNDAHCDSGTVQGPFGISGTLNGDTLSAGGVAQYTCSHVVTANDLPQFTNVAIVTGTPPSGPPVHGHGTVVANITSAAIQVVKLEKDASGSGGFTRGPITVTEHSGNYVVHTIEYEIQVTNTGNAPLTLSLNDPRCDSGTVQGPAVITGTLNGDVLSAGGQAQYTCSHRYVQGDSATFTNVATVTGTPPNGPAVHGTSRVTVERKTVFPKTKLCRTPTGRVIHYTGHKKPKACRFHPKPPKNPRGFTG